MRPPVKLVGLSHFMGQGIPLYGSIIPTAMRLPESYRANPQSMQEITLRSPGGAQVKLDQVAQVRVIRAAIEIDREEGQRRMVVMSNVRGRDLGSFVQRCRPTSHAR
jgi:Cu/Ag efflux pump CusA